MRFNERNILVLSGSADKDHVNDGDEYYRIEPLSDDYERSKGGNSFVFKAIDSDEVEYIVKFCKFPNIARYKKQNNRFQQEIDVLDQANEEGCEHVIKFYFSGFKKIEETGNYHHYYVMEKGDQDLRSFLLNNNLPNNQKYFLCYDIIKGIEELHAMGYYHRDIKPDNIFIVNQGTANNWKIGDLGLSIHQDDNSRKLEFQEKIGPIGWLSPEVTNKFLCEGTPYEGQFDCRIDAKSDVFQLGKLLWYIFQNNIPVGQVTFEDFKVKNKILFDLLFEMLQYNKTRRKSLSHYSEEFELLSN